MKLMVYGTLQRGHWNNRLLEGAQYIGKAITRKPYVLYHCGFPMAVPHSINPERLPLLPIIGEVYEAGIDNVLRCDRLEGHPDWYQRTKIVAEVNGEEHEVFIYEMPTPPAHQQLCSIVDNMYYQWVG